MRPPPTSIGYVPSLDGLRAVSISLVILSHYGWKVVPGIFGVTIFFFISGYLITSLLLREVAETRTIMLGPFYMRRMLRLYPALFVMIAFSAFFFPLVGSRVTGGDVFGAVMYLANYWPVMTGGMSSGVPHAIHPFSVLWSLAVEEHFYLVFPALCLLFGGRTIRLAGIIVLLIAGVTYWRYRVAASCALGGCVDLWPEHATHTRADSILYGSLLATLLASPLREATLGFLRSRITFAFGLVLLLAGLAIRDAWFRDNLRFTMQGIGLFMTVGAIVHAPSLAVARGLLSCSLALRIGRWSYSLYLWHWVVLCAASIMLPRALSSPVVDMRAMPPLWWLAGVFLPLAVVFTALSAASYHWIEQPVVALRRRFGSAATAEQPGPASPVAPAARTVAP